MPLVLHVYDFSIAQLCQIINDMEALACLYISWHISDLNQCEA